MWPMKWLANHIDVYLLPRRRGFMWSALWCTPHLPNTEICIDQNSAFFLAIVRVVKDI